MSAATINAYLNGYPDAVGNKKRVVVILNGPTTYEVGGVAIPAIAHVPNIHQVTATVNNATYVVVPRIHGANKVGKSTDVKLVFIVVASGLEAGAIDLSATKVRLELQGTN